MTTESKKRRLEGDTEDLEQKRPRNWSDEDDYKNKEEKKILVKIMTNLNLTKSDEVKGLIDLYLDLREEHVELLQKHEAWKRNAVELVHDLYGDDEIFEIYDIENYLKNKVDIKRAYIGIGN